MFHANVRHHLAFLACSMLLAACSQKSPCVTKGVKVDVITEHPHSAAVPSHDVERGAARTYAIEGDGHKHLFTLTADDMKKLQHGDPVTTRSTSSNGHIHEVDVVCKQ